MKVILVEDVRKQGKKGDILELKDGYAQFLIKNKQAVIANVAGVNKLNRENEAREKEEALKLKEAEELKNKIEKLDLSFAVKTGAGDKVFGSVSPKQIAEELKNKGITVDKKQIKENEALASLGGHYVDVELHKKVVAKLHVTLTK